MPYPSSLDQETSFPTIERIPKSANTGLICVKWHAGRRDERAESTLLGLEAIATRQGTPCELALGGAGRKGPRRVSPFRGGLPGRRDLSVLRTIRLDLIRLIRSNNH